jgi:CelD/BcsL family acetyltransferase involved in cellulose biosynthesis
MSTTATLFAPVVEPEVSEINDFSTFCTMEREWNHLVTTHNNRFFLRHEFQRAWIESFAPSGSLKILTCRVPDGRLKAVLPLMHQRSEIHGVRVREIVATSNEHSCRFDMTSEDPQAEGKAFFEYLADQDDWDVIRIGDVPEGGQAWHLYQAAEAAGHPVGAWESQRSPYLTLPTTFLSEEEAMRNVVSSHQRQNVRRRIRQMEQKSADVSFDYAPPQDLESRLAEFYDIESSGWKGREGTACGQEESTRAFYSSLARLAAAQDWLSLSRLTVDGQTLAMNYGIVYDSRLLILKTTFREEYKEVSPGLVLMHETIRDSIAKQRTLIDFLGTDDEWKLRWTRTVRSHHWLYIFRNNLKGRLLQKAKFSWAPKVKEVLSRGTTNA